MMIPVLFVMWCIASPAGYLAGDVFLSQREGRDDIAWLPFACAAFPPLAAAVALMVLATANQEEDNQ